MAGGRALGLPAGAEVAGSAVLIAVAVTAADVTEVGAGAPNVTSDLTGGVASEVASEVGGRDHDGLGVSVSPRQPPHAAADEDRQRRQQQAPR